MEPDDDTSQAEEQPADDQPAEQSEEQSADSGQPAEQSEEQPADTDQPAEQSEEQPVESDQPTEQSEEQAAAEDQTTEPSEEQAADSDQSATSASANNTLAFAGGTASPGGGGTGLQARPGPRPKRSPTLVKRRFVFRFVTARGSVDSTPPPLVDMVNNALAGGLLAFRIEEVVPPGKTVLVAREVAATIPRPTLPPPSDVNKDDPGDLVYHFNSVGMDLSISLVVTTPALGTDFSNQLEKVITSTDWHDSTEAGLSEPTFFVKGEVFASYSLVPVSDRETLDSALKARNISRKDIFYLSEPRARTDALHTMEYDVMTWEFLSAWGDRLTPR